MPILALAVSGPALAGGEERRERERDRSLQTRRWREMDSNHRSLIEESPVGPRSRQYLRPALGPSICPPSIAETDGARGWTGSPRR
jgi:hypothetical protein